MHDEDPGSLAGESGSRGRQSARPSCIPLHEAPIVSTVDDAVVPPSQYLPPVGDAVVDLGERLRRTVAINVIHDGRVVPAEFLRRDGQNVEHHELDGLYTRERDWGASLVAGYLAGALGLDGFLHVHIARVLMDFGRFPGLTPEHAAYLERYAINTPFSQWLDFQGKRALLERCYDRISDHMDQALSRKVLTIGVHTYDVYNQSGTLRPELSILNRTMGYQRNSRMPAGLFDPLYPDRLGEFTCDRVLPSRISLHLERNGLPVAQNYPYLLPEGSVEVRSQVWHFFDWVRHRMADTDPEVLTHPAFARIWRMLLDTNRRSSESQALRSYLHMFRTAPPGREREFEQARHTYEAVRSFLRAGGGRVIDEYRFGEGRPGAIGIEIRKDLVWQFDDQGRAVAPRHDNAQRIARLVAQAIGRYFLDDLHRRIPFNQEIRDPALPHDVGVGASKEPPR